MPWFKINCIKYVTLQRHYDLKVVILIILIYTLIYDLYYLLLLKYDVLI